MSNLEQLLKAYVDLSNAWVSASIGENKSSIASSCRFLEKMIKEEMKNNKYCTSCGEEKRA